MAAKPKQLKRVRVLHDYDYTAEDRVISFKKGTEYNLLKKTNEEWWSVQKPGEPKAVFVPANYVEEIQPNAKPKKAPPPKPPNKPRLPRPALEPDAAIKVLDDVLDTVIATMDDDDMFSEESSKEKNQTETEKETASGSSDEKLSSSSDSLKDKVHGSSGSVNEEKNLRPSAIYANSQIFGKPAPNPKSQSLDRNTSKFLSSPKAGHSRSSSASVVSPTARNGENEARKPMPQPRLTGINYFEEPEYANLQELDAVKKPPPRPPPPKVKKPVIIKRTPTDSDGSDEDPDYANLQTMQDAIFPKHPPPNPPPPSSTPIKTIDTDWRMYHDAATDRPYYHNPAAGKSQWRDPSQDSMGGSMSSSTEDVGRSPKPSESLPSGWEERSSASGDAFFFNEYSQEKWLRSSDETGQVYYYKEGSSESSWELPEINPARCNSLEKVLSEEDHRRLNQPKTRASWSPGDYSLAKRVHIPLPKKLSPTVKEEEEDDGNGEVFQPVTDSPDPLANVRMSSIPSHKRSVALGVNPRMGVGVHVGAHLTHLDLYTRPPSSPHSVYSSRAYSHAHPIREMQAVLNKTKITENGRKVKKNWSQAYVVTTGPAMYFYKDQKSAQPKPNLPLGKYEAELDLHGAKIEVAPKETSSKKNVIQISTPGMTQYLLQSDDKSKMQDWHNTLVVNSGLLSVGGSHMSMAPPSPGSPASSSKFRHKSALSKKNSNTLDRPTTPDDTLTGSEKNNKVKDWLLYWLLRRPTAESLKEKGIIKDGIFGSHLQSICDREKLPVPRFVTDCIATVEKRGLAVDGIYRISGNMAAIQKIRFRVDHNEPYDLMQPDCDIHDISGALKLFFRELQEPLFPFHLYDKFTKASQILNQPLKLKAFQDVIKEMPRVNYNTMRELIGHLRKVVEHSKENRMEAQNVAIVFGPTLMRPEQETGNMAANLVMQGQIVEYMLHQFRALF